MNLRVAILAGASRHTLAGCAAGQLTRRRRLIGAEKRPGMTDRQVVALLAKVGSCCDQQLVVIGAMHGVAVGAVLTHGGVLPQERPALFGVTGVANDVGAFGFQQGLGGAAVWIMAIHARHFPFWQRHVRALVEFSALLLVTARAGFIHRALGEQAADRIFFHGIVAIRTTQFIVGVYRAGPM